MFKKIWNSYHVRRCLSRSAFLKDSNKPAPSQTQTSSPTSTNTNVSNENLLRQEIRPSEWEKFLLVFSKRYKTKEEIPPKISIETMVKAKSLVRIKLANLMIALTLLSCLYVVLSSKKKAKEGESIVKKEKMRQELIRSKAREEALKANNDKV